MKDSLFRRFWWTTLLIELLLAMVVPLVADETYYWVWSKHLQLSYYDHPPFISWLFLLGHPFETLGHAVRWPGIIFGHLSLWILYEIFNPYMPKDRRFWWLLILTVNPLCGWGALIMTPDVPLVVFWGLSLLSLLRYLKTPNWQWALCLGASLGLGFLSKYQIVLFLPLLFLFLTIDKKWKQLQWRHVLGAVAAGLLMTLPVLLWNVQNGFESFRFQIQHGLGAPRYNPIWSLEYIGGQILLIFPVFLWILLRKSNQKFPSWMPIFGWGPILFFFLATFKGRSEANWPIAAYPVLLSFACLKAPSTKWIRGTVLTWVGILFLVLLEVFFKWIPLDPGKVKTDELRAFDTFMPLVDSYTPLYASSFQMAAMLNYKTKTPVFKLQGMGRRDFYDYLPESRPTAPEFFLAANSQWDKLPDWALKEYKIKEIIPVVHEKRLLWMKRRE